MAAGSLLYSGLHSSSSVYRYFTLSLASLEASVMQLSRSRHTWGGGGGQARTFLVGVAVKEGGVK